MWISLLKRFLGSLVLVAVILGIGYAIYQKGHSEGSQDVQLQWELEKAATKAAYDKLEAEYAKREEAHRAENTKITHELAEARRLHDLALADLRRDLGHRLLLSEERSSVYKRKAESGAAECRDLAGHAARLDRTLEEGRSLVRELRGTLGLRDHQLKELGRQILNDRKLLED